MEAPIVRACEINRYFEDEAAQPINPLVPVRVRGHMLDCPASIGFLANLGYDFAGKPEAQCVADAFAIGFAHGLEFEHRRAVEAHVDHIAANQKPLPSFAEVGPWVAAGLIALVVIGGLIGFRAF